MHNCPSCKKLTSNLLTPVDGAIKEDICDECTVIALSLCAPDFDLLEGRDFSLIEESFNNYFYEGCQ